MVVRHRLGQAVEIGSLVAKHPAVAGRDEQLVHGRRGVEVHRTGGEEAAEPVAS